VSGRDLPSPGPFAADDGAADPGLARALADYTAGRADLRTVHGALLGARVLVPVVPRLDEEGSVANGLAVEKRAHLAVVTVTGRDGRRALPVFTCMDTLASWDPGARPVPTTACDAARSAYAEGAAALLLDLGWTAVAVVEGPALLALAEHRPWLPPAQDPDVVAAVHAALDGLPLLAGVDVGPSADADIAVTLHVPPGGDDRQETARHVAQAAAGRLAEVDLLRARLDRGIDVAVLPD
jgi:hypothetical protein